MLSTSYSNTYHHVRVRKLHNISEGLNIVLLSSVLTCLGLIKPLLNLLLIYNNNNNLQLYYTLYERLQTNQRTNVLWDLLVPV